MTRFETLIACRNHWQWMAITGNPHKSDYSPSNKWPFNCVCCLYAGAYIKNSEEVDITERDCSICPLLDYAWSIIDSGDIYDPYDAPCEFNGYFTQWIDFKYNFKLACFYAQQIVNACNRAIEDLIIKGEV